MAGCVTAASIPLCGLIGIRVSYCRVRCHSSMKDYESIPEEGLAALGPKPVPIEFSPVEEIVSHAANEPQDEFRMVLVVRESRGPVQKSVP
ncbi:hypothetical protein D9M71_726670 [compost metagenome]